MADQLTKFARILGPIQCSLNLTNRCNLRCRMCNVWKIVRREKELKLEEWKNIVNRVIDAFSLRFFRLIGGEPFLHPHFKEIVHYIKAKGCRLSIISNGTLISTEMARFLVSEHADHIRISIDGLQKTNDFYRGKGAFAVTMKGVKALVKEKRRQSLFTPKIEIRALVSKANCEEMDELLRLAKQINADFKHHYLVGATTEKDSRTQDPGFPEDLEKPSVLNPQEKRNFEERFSREMSFRRRIPYILFSKIREFPIRYDCLKNACMLGIDPWGYVVPCEHFYKYPYGNCRDSTIEEIWRSQKRTNLRWHIKNGNLPVCQACGIGGSWISVQLSRLATLWRDLMRA